MFVGHSRESTNNTEKQDVLEIGLTSKMFSMMKKNSARGCGAMKSLLVEPSGKWERGEDTGGISRRPAERLLGVLELRGLRHFCSTVS